MTEQIRPGASGEAAGPWPYQPAPRVPEDGGRTADVFTLYDGLELLLFPVMVAAYVVSCLWLQLSRRNALAISAELRPGGAAPPTRPG